MRDWNIREVKLFGVGEGVWVGDWGIAGLGGAIDEERTDWYGSGG